MLLTAELANVIYDKVHKDLFKKPKCMSYNIIHYAILNFLHFKCKLCYF